MTVESQKKISRSRQMSRINSQLAFVDDFSRFNECFDVFCRGRFEQERSLSVEKLIKGLTNSHVFDNLGDRLNVLSVGSGNGKFDILFVEELTQHTLARNCRIRWTVVDPNRPAIREFKKTLKAYDFEIPGVDFVWVENRFEDFVKVAETKKRRYSLVLFMNCFYYMNADYALKKSCGHLLAQPGAIFISEVGAKSIAHQIHKEFRVGYGVMSAEEAIRKMATNFPLKTKKFTVELKLNVTDLFSEENKNAGDKLLQFLLHANPSDLDDQMKQTIRDYIQANSWQEKKRGGGETYVASNETTLHLVFNM